MYRFSHTQQKERRDSINLYDQERELFLQMGKNFRRKEPKKKRSALNSGLKALSDKRSERSGKGLEEKKELEL